MLYFAFGSYGQDFFLNVVRLFSPRMWDALYRFEKSVAATLSNQSSVAYSIMPNPRHKFHARMELC